MLLASALCSVSLMTSITARADSTTTTNKWVVLPIISYSPETKLALGAYGAYYFGKQSAADSIPSSVARFTLAYTTRKQYLLSTSPDVYFDGGRFRAGGELSFARFPDKFYGIGNTTRASAEEEYISRRVRVFLRGLKNVTNEIKAGLVIDYENTVVTSRIAGGQLATLPIPGAGGATSTGVGAAFTFDTRNHVFTPSSGVYTEMFITFFPRDLLNMNTFGFSTYITDCRVFFPVVSDHVLGVQVYGRFTAGTPPFQRLAALGGPYRMRGIYEGRYRDKQMLEFQTEYRIPIAGKWGIVGFAGTGDVAGSVAGFELQNFKYSAGAGIRYMIAPEERVNIRLDYAFASGGVSNLYITIEEAF